MRKYFFAALATGFTLGAILFSAVPAYGQVAGSLWKLQSNSLFPITSTWGITIPSLASLPCIGTNGSGIFGAGTCGSGSGSGTISTTSPGLTSGQPVYATGLSTVASVASSTFLTSLGLSLPVSIANGGTATSSAVTNGVCYFNGTNIECDSLLTYDGNGALAVNGTGGNVHINAGNNTGEAQLNLTGFNSLHNAGFTYSSGTSGRTFLYTNTSASGVGPQYIIFGVPKSGSTNTYLLGLNASTTPGAYLSIAGSAGGTTPLFMLSTSTSGFATSTDLVIDKNGNETFYGTVTWPSITGTQCLHAINGLISGTGSDCGSGSGGISSIGPVGQLQTGPTVTIATSTASFNGLTVGDTWVGSGNTLTSTPTWSGTLNNSGLTNSSLTVNGTSIALGASGTITAASSTLLSDFNNFTNLQKFNGGASTTQLSASGQIFGTATGVGSVTAPSYSFTGNTNYGFYLSGTTIQVTTGGSGRVNFNSSGIQMVNAAGANITNATAVSLTIPNIVPDRGDLTTGFASGIQGNINTIVSGVETSRWTSTGYGVGTSTPGALLSVNGAWNSATPLFLVGTTTLTGTSTVFRINANGSVGIPALGIAAGQFAAFDPNGNFIGTTTPGGYSPVGTTGQFPYFNGTNTLIATSSIFIAANGSIGIGSTTPSAPLSIGSGSGADTVASSSVWTSPGTFTYTVPANTAYIIVSAVGGGGGCQFSGTASVSGYGGYVASTSINTSAGATFTIKVAQQGTARTGGGTGFATGGSGDGTTNFGSAGGGSSAFGSGIIAPGGGGCGNNNSGNNASGTSGGAGGAGAVNGGGGGGAAATNGANGVSGTAGAGGTGGSVVSAVGTTIPYGNRATIGNDPTNGGAVWVWAYASGDTAKSASVSIYTGELTPALIISGVAEGITYLFFKIDQYAHIITGGPTPVLGACGTSPAIFGNDTNMRVHAGSGALSSCTINFANAYANPPVCTVAAETGTLAFMINASTTQSTLTLGGGTLTSDWFTAHCEGY